MHKKQNVGTSLLLSILSFSAVTGCSGSSSSPPTPSEGSSQFSSLGLPVDSNGFRRFLYVATGAPGDGIQGFSYDSDAGTIAALPNALARTPEILHRIVTTSDGNFLYGIDTDGPVGHIYSFSVDFGTGALTPLPSGIYSVSFPSENTQEGFFEMLRRFNLNGVDYLYASDYGSDEIYAFSIDASSGTLSTVPGSPFSTPSGCTPADMAVTPDRKYFYTACQHFGVDTGEQMVGFNLDPTTGKLLPLQTAFSAPAGSAIYGLTITRNGLFLYATGINNDAINAWSINDVDGSLTPLAGSPYYQNAGFPFLSWTDAAGLFLYFININDFTNQIEFVDLDPQTGIPSNPTSYSLEDCCTTHPSANDLGFDPDGLALAETSQNTVHLFLRESALGTLTEAQGSPAIVNSTGDSNLNPDGVLLIKVQAMPNPNPSPCVGIFCAANS